MSNSKLVELARERIVVLDGAMGTSLQMKDLPLSDYNNLENCSEILLDTRPDVIRDIHRSYLEVGCDAVLTNTFGANNIVLSEFGIASETRRLNRVAVELAREACVDFERPGKPKFVIGSIGPGTKLPSLDQVDWDTLLDSYAEQVRGLLDGQVDAILIETCQDILQAKCAVVAAADILKERGVDNVPIFCTLTMETSGTLLIGTELAAAVTALQAYDQVVGIGLNCATGPQEMSEHVCHLGEHCDRLLIVQPNAGLPQLVDGKLKYALTPAELSRWLCDFVDVSGVNIVGGCCGTTPHHLAAVVEAMEDRVPKTRRVRSEPSVSSVYQAVTIQQDANFLAIGERTNANGSKKFRDLLAADDIDGMVEVAREQVKDNHLIDVCVAYVGRNELADMTALVKRLRTDVVAPLVIDSTEPNVLEAALKLAGGKCVINSINLEAGEEKLAEVCGLAKRYGAALIALTIDEEGMARTAQSKVEIAARIYELATRRYGISPRDLIFDPLTFTICTGNPEDQRLALETLDAISDIADACPGSHTLLGISNVSFGVKTPLRRVLNSVFLHHARERGLSSAIIHASGIMPYYKIDDHLRRLAEDLIFARCSDDHNPLQLLLQAVETDSGTVEAPTEEAKTIEQRLMRRVIEGDRRGIDADLEEAMLTYQPLDIINEILLDGMKTVGDLFGAGQIQLPFVLQSAETMKAAVRYLEPFMDKTDDSKHGTLVLATVRGDVHDIGKNLVDIILTNNGYKVVNLGIKQPINNIISAAKEHNATAIGMSGLLVKSTAVMGENLLVLNEHQLDLPVILGGAALTRKFVEQDLRAKYKGPLFYAKDAFEGLGLMQSIVAGDHDSVRQAEPEREPALAASGADDSTTIVSTAPPEPQIAEKLPSSLHRRDERLARADLNYERPKSDISKIEPIPTPPFYGSRLIDSIDLAEVLPYLNERMLFQTQWQYRKTNANRANFDQYIEREVRPILGELLDRCEKDEILIPKAIYGFWPAQSDGDALLIYDPDDHTKLIETFDFPRMGKPPYWCLSDFFRSVASGELDVVAFSIVTVGARVSEVARQWLDADEYKDYLHLHGLGVEMAEALAEYIHKRIRHELGIDGQDAKDVKALFRQHYQGARYSFGYPACPRLEDQLKLWPLLNPDLINVNLSEEFQLDPEQTTTALIVHHKQARYFNVR